MSARNGKRERENVCVCVCVCEGERRGTATLPYTRKHFLQSSNFSNPHHSRRPPPTHTHSSIVSIVSCGRNTHAQVLVHGGLKRAVDAVVLVVAHVVAVQHSRHALLEERQEGVPVVGG